MKWQKRTDEGIWRRAGGTMATRDRIAIVPPLFAVVFMTVKGTILIYHSTILVYKNWKKTGIIKGIMGICHANRV